jgi:hypothetical protein
LHPQAQANTTIFHHTKTAKSDWFISYFYSTFQ